MVCVDDNGQLLACCERRLVCDRCLARHLQLFLLNFLKEAFIGLVFASE